MSHLSYWNQPISELMHTLKTTPGGLTGDEAKARLAAGGLNTLLKKQRQSTVRLFLSQFKDPLLLILFFAVGVSLIAGEWVDAGVVFVVIISSSMLSFVQEYNATNAVKKLLTKVEIKASVLRDGAVTSIPSELVVPGDIVFLSAGNLIPGDGIVLQTKACFIDQAALSGETFPVEKSPGIVHENASLPERINSIFMGTSVRSGTATALIVETGTRTVYGQIAERLTLRPPETEFERGIHHFGYLLARIVLVFVLFVFTINVLADKPAIDSLLFAIALAVGMAPELLPAIITITLSKGAQQMATEGVIVRRLNAIENFGNMDVLCTDKTGTLTQGAIQLHRAFDIEGTPSDQVFLYAYLNARFQLGIHNPLDDAILASPQAASVQAADYHKIDEVPYDFIRRRLSIITAEGGKSPLLVTKGALDSVLDTSRFINRGGRVSVLDSASQQQIQQLFSQWSAQGFRVLGVSTKIVPTQASYSADDECDLVFQGFLLFFDPPKPDVQTTIEELSKLGVQLKIISGDNRQITEHVAAQVGLAVTGILTGSELAEMRDEALWRRAEKTTLFVEVDPNQKERIIQALQKTGHVVGYMGDGINDAPALHAADVGISVDQAVDVAKEAADFVLLEHSLRVLHLGIINGRKTFANTLKYILTTTSANFGNMFSMAGLSLFLPFLPLLPKQILLNNFLSDLPGLAIASDNVDQQIIERPNRWDIQFIRNFMIVFGLVSSLFDFITFGILLGVLQASPEQFRTAWFIESLLTELVIALVVRTRRPFFKSQPGKWLLLSTAVVATLTLVLPYLPVTTMFEFVPLPLPMMLTLLGITGFYVVATELAKKFFYVHANRPSALQTHRNLITALLP